MNSNRPVSSARRNALRYAGAAGAALVLGACRREEPGRPQPSAAPNFDAGALRADVRHLIGSRAERFELMRLRAEPVWGGRNDRLEAALDWGDYRFSVYEPSSRALLFREGFDSSIDTNARGAATELSVRFPSPAHAVEAVIEKRRGASAFTQAWSMAIDPADAAIERSPATAARVETLLSNGAPAAKVDIAILGDGYNDAEHTKFTADAKRAMDYLFSVDPFGKRKRDFNVHAVFVASAESGVTDPYLGVISDTVFRCAYGSGQAERTLTVANQRALRDAAASVPYDFLLVLANSRRYGGSAHFGGPAVVAIDSGAAKYLVIHEFAHVVAGLADEYYIPDASGPAYAGNIEPWNPNVTLSADARKWSDGAGTTTRREPWNKTEYDRHLADYVKRYFLLRDQHADESAVEKLMEQERRRQATLLAKSGPLRRVALFEGGNGYSRGVYRSEVSCIMFSLQTDYFCRACASAIERMIDRHCA